MAAHGRKNVFSRGWDNLRRSGALPLGADFCGVDRYYRRLVGAEIGKLDRPRCRRRPRPSRVEAQHAKRVGQFQVGDAIEDQAPADPCVSKDFALAHRKKLPARKSEQARALVGKPGNSDDLKSNIQVL
jgi:hypothetical protein